jgi:hypothetical protein
MMLALCAVGGGVAIHVDDARGLSNQDLEQLTDALKRAIEDRSGQNATVDAADPPTCTASDRCVDRIRSRTESGDVVFLTLIGVPTRIRVVAERVAETKITPTARVETDLLRAERTWSETLGAIAAKLFPEGATIATTTADTPSIEASRAVQATPNLVPPERVETTPPAKSVSVLPWAAIGAGAVALAVGVGFGLDSKAARDSAANMPHTSSEIDDLRGRAIGHAWVANILYGVALVGVGVGVGLLVFD